MKNSALTALISTSLLLTGCGLEPETDAKETGSANTEEVAPPGHQKMTRTSSGSHTELTKKPNFDISVQTYGETLNKLLQGTEFADKTITDLSEGDSDKVFITDYTHQISVVGEVSEDDKLEDLTYTMPVNDSIKTEANSLIELTAASMQVLNTNVDANQAKESVSKLINQVIANFEETSEQQQAVGVVEGKVYVAQISDRGLRFLIEPAEDSRFAQ